MCSDPAGNFVVVWNGNSNEGFRIFGRRYSSLGIPLSDEFEISVNPQVALQPIPRVACDQDGNFIATWAVAIPTGSQGTYGSGIAYRLFTYSGVAVSGEEYAATNPSYASLDQPTVAVSGNGNFILTWVSNGQDGDLLGTYARQFDASGNPIGGVFQVNSTTEGSQLRPSVSADTLGNFGTATTVNMLMSLPSDSLPTEIALAKSFGLTAQLIRGIRASRLFPLTRLETLLSHG